jgi:hypothetical protein
MGEAAVGGLDHAIFAVLGARLRLTLTPIGSSFQVARSSFGLHLMGGEIGRAAEVSGTGQRLAPASASGH